MTDIFRKMNFHQRHYVFHGWQETGYYAIVQSCIGRDIEQDSILLQCWEKEYVRALQQSYAPIIHAVPVESFGECALVVEDDPAVREAIDQKNVEPGCTLVLPIQVYWVKQFLSWLKYRYKYDSAIALLGILLLHLFLHVYHCTPHNIGVIIGQNSLPEVSNAIICNMCFQFIQVFYSIIVSHILLILQISDPTHFC